jgi:hypothetical protein
LRNPADLPYLLKKWATKGKSTAVNTIQPLLLLHPLLPPTPILTPTALLAAAVIAVKKTAAEKVKEAPSEKRIAEERKREKGETEIGKKPSATTIPMNPILPTMKFNHKPRSVKC